MNNFRKKTMVLIMVLGMVVLCSCNSNVLDLDIPSTEEPTTEMITTEATTTEVTTTEATTTEVTTTEATTTEATTTEATTVEVTTEVTNIISDNGVPMSYKEAVNAYKDERDTGDGLYKKKFWIQHEDRLYSLDTAYVRDEMVNKYIKFADSNFSVVKMYPGDLLIEFDGTLGFTIAFVESEGYTVPQDFKVDADSGCIQFYKKNLSSRLEEASVPLCKIYEVNGETASNIQDYIEVHGDYYLSYPEPTGVFYKYYYDFESKEGSVTTSVKYYTIGERYDADAQVAPEGYGYYKIPEGTPAGLYCVWALGYSFIVEVIE